MLLDSVIMAAGVSLASIVALGDNVPIRNRPHDDDAPDSRRVGMVDVVMIIFFAIAGSLAFNVLANAG